MILRRDLYLFGSLFLLILGLGACSGGDDAPARAASPDEAVVQSARALADGTPQVLWQALPASYQKDVTELVHQAAGEIDAELWSQTFGVLQKFARLLEEKREFILEHPMLASQIEDRGDVEANWDTVVGLFDAVVNSELSDLDEVKKLDIESFLAGTGAEIMGRLAEASALTAEDAWAEQMKALRATKATVVSSSGDSAMLRIERPGQEPIEEEYVRIEDRWVSRKIADGWSAQIAEMRQAIARFSGEESQPNRQAVLMQLAMLDDVLDTVLAADTAEEFNAGVGAAMGMVMGAVMARATGGQRETLSPYGELAPAPSGQPTVAQPGQGEDPGASLSLAGTASPLPYLGGEIPVESAGDFVGRTVNVTSKSGVNATCKLAAARGDVLVFERSVGGGTVSFELSPEDIETLTVATQ